MLGGGIPSGPRRRIRRRRNHPVRRFRRRLAYATLAILTIAICFVFNWPEKKHTPRHQVVEAAETALPSSISNPPGKTSSARSENIYAVVRGGICTTPSTPGEEAASRKKWEALLQDPLWMSVFSSADPRNFHLVRLPHTILRYVTYLKPTNGQLIHWTGKRIRIPAGTRVFTDGRGNMYLCACGNQVSDSLSNAERAKVLVEVEEPPLIDLVPVEPGVILFDELPVKKVKLSPQAPPPLTPTKKPVPPPSVIPEPSPISLLALGLGFFLALFLYRRTRAVKNATTT